MKAKKRNPFVAFLLSILCTGLGQIYNGQFKKGVIFYSVELLILLSLSILGLSFYGLIVFIVICLAWFLLVAADSVFTAIKIKQVKLKKFNRWYVYLIIFLISEAIFLVGKPIFWQVKRYSMPAGSMEDTLLIGDHLLVNKLSYGIHNPFTNKILIPIGKPQRGDVTVFIFPQDPSKEYIKRVIGLPGDKVQIIDKKVYINGELYETPQAHYAASPIIPAPKSSKDSARDNFGPRVVPPDAYFVLGDNRDKSYDSRFWGFVPVDLMRGKALYIYFSLDQKDSRVRWDRIGLTIN